MQIGIGAFDEATSTVPVTFTEGDIVHARPVNACRTEAGAYDAEATEARIADVARGVAVKIAAGAIRNPDPVEAPEAAAD